MSENLNTKFCNGCGEKILYDAKFCTKCGFKQIRIAKDKDYILNENNSLNDDYNNKFETNKQLEKSKSNIGIILLSGLVIVGLLSYLYFQNNKPNDKYLTAAADSVAVDTVSGTQEIDTSEVVVSNLTDIVTLLDKKQTLFLAPRKDGRSVMTKSYFGDLNDDGIEDAFVEWGLMKRGKELDNGGGNANISNYFMRGFSVYLKIGDEYVLKADKRDDSFDKEGLSNYTVDKIENGKIICYTLTYADEDPRCCPSLKETIYLVFQNNEIIKPNQVVKVGNNEN